MKRIRTAIFNIPLILLVSLGGLTYAAGPETRVTDSATVTEINKLAASPASEAFEKLKDVKYTVDEELMDKAVIKAYSHRKNDALKMAENSLRLPVLDIVDGKPVDRTPDFYISKNILEAFPDDSFAILERLYREGDPVTKGNVVRAAGNIAGGAIDNILLEALNDQTPVEENYIEKEGEPMRICDIAYNQLVLRYQVMNVLRTIGTVHEIEVRDYHISIFKSALGR